MVTMDATARVAKTARLGDGVEIGPHCVVGPEVELKDGVRLIAHVTVTGATTIGEATLIYPFASLGTPPQSVHYRGELRRAFRSLFLGDGEFGDRIERVASTFADDPLVQKIVAFVGAGGKRALMHPRRR